jgi:hypothetical protein
MTDTINRPPEKIYFLSDVKKYLNYYNVDNFGMYLDKQKRLVVVVPRSMAEDIKKDLEPRAADGTGIVVKASTIWSELRFLWERIKWSLFG